MFLYLPQQSLGVYWNRLVRLLSVLVFRHIPFRQTYPTIVFRFFFKLHSYRLCDTWVCVCFWDMFLPLFLELLPFVLPFPENSQFCLDFFHNSQLLLPVLYVGVHLFRFSSKHMASPTVTQHQHLLTITFLSIWSDFVQTFLICSIFCHFIILLRIYCISNMAVMVSDQS